MDLKLIQAYFIKYEQLMNHVSNNNSCSNETAAVTDSTKELNQIELEDYAVLPTFHRLQSLKQLLDACISDVYETFCGDDENKRKDPPSSVRPLLNYLELLLALSTLHNYRDFSEKILIVMRRVGLISRRLHDERYAYACSVLNFIESGQTVAAQKLVDSKPSCLTVLPNCPENKAFVIELADIVFHNIGAKDESLCNKLRILSTSYESHFQSMTPEAVISHSICLLWRLKTRLQVGDETLFDEDSVFYFAERVREISYSLAYFCFGDLSSGSKPCESMFKSKVNNLLSGWSALHYLTESTYCMARMFAIIGSCRESVCMLNSLKKISRKFCLPERMIQCLQLALHFDQYSGRESTMLLHNKQIEFIQTSIDPFVVKPVVDEEEEEENFLLHSKLAQLDVRSVDNDHQLISKASHRNEFTGSSPLTNRKKNPRQSSSPVIGHLYDTLDGADWFTKSQYSIKQHVFGTNYVFHILNSSPASQTDVDVSTPINSSSSNSYIPDSQQNSSINSSNSLVNLLNNFKTPESVAASRVLNNSNPPAPAKPNVSEQSSTPLINDASTRRKVTRRKPRNCKVGCTNTNLEAAMQNLALNGVTANNNNNKISLLALGQAMEAENTTEDRRRNRKRHPGGKAVLVERNTAEKEEIVDSIEVNPSAPYIPANIRLKSRLKTKQHHCVYEEKNVIIEPKNKEETEMSNEVYQELTTSFRQLRWLPVPSLFRPLCHLLALQSLQQTSPNVHDQMKAAFYLTNSVFIAFRVNYENELIKKLKNKLNNCASLSTALTTFQDCHRDVPSWNDAIRRTLPSNWLIIQFTLINELNISISGDNPVFLLATKLRSTDAPQTRIIKGFSMKGIDDFENLLVENLQSTSLTKANVYWNKRYNLDHDMEKLLLTTKEQWFSQDDLNWLMSDQTESDPIVLILDRNLSNYPFEWLLSNSSQLHITRMPCLSIALSHLYVTSLITVNNNDQPSTVDTENNRKLIIQDGFYVLNPERNLPSTEQRLMPLLSNPSLNWKGVIGRPPTKDEAIRAMEEHQILMYCGHGSGSRYLFPKILAITRSKAMALLFGCSSSRLLQEGKFEPTSSMLTHLIAGSPCILGLLWDVTDGDIDRYSCRLLESWQSSDNGSKFLHVVRESRMACKLRHLIGKSPVVYGYPLEKR